MGTISRFSVARLRPKDRFDAWHASIGCIFDVSRPAVEVGEFFASVDSIMVGQAMIARTRSVAQSWQRPGWKIAHDGLDHYMFQLYSIGSQVYRGTLEGRTMPHSGLLVYDLSRPMAAQTSQFENLSLIIPRAVLAPLLSAPESHHLRSLAADAPFVSLLYNTIRSTWHHAANISDLQAKSLCESCVHLAAACLNSESGILADPQPQPGPQLLTARRLIDEFLGLPELGVDWMVARLGLSRSRIYELFHELGGVAGYIRDRRLAVAMRTLTDPAHAGVPIAEIARLCGFSPNELSRSFRKHYGVSPRGARHHGIKSGRTIDTGRLDRSYEHWIRHLAPPLPDAVHTYTGRHA